MSLRRVIRSTIPCVLLLGNRVLTISTIRKQVFFSSVSHGGGETVPARCEVILNVDQYCCHIPIGAQDTR